MNIIKKFRNGINNSLLNSFSRREKREVLNFFVVLMMIFAVSFIMRLFDDHTPPTLDSETTDKLAALDKRFIELREGDTLSRLDRYIVQRYDTLQLFDFDPNTVTTEELLKLGFTEKQAGNLSRYRENGGHFREPDDLRKLYGMRTMQYKILKPYISIAGATAANGNKKSDNKKRENKDFHDSKTADTPSKTAAKEYFEFDPNTITEDEMQRLGFSEKQTQSFINWRTKGKKFYVAKDFASAYCVDEKRYKELEPYIKIDLQKLFGSNKMLDLNTVTDADLRSIGLTTDEAMKIIDFRNHVGYYFSNWQIEDALPNKKRANELKAKFYVCASVEIQKININTAPLDRLETNPYFTPDQAAKIVNLRENQKFTSMEDMKNTGLFSDKALKRLANYLSF